MNCGFMIKFIYEQYLNLLWILLCMIGYRCKSLRIISLVWPTRLIFLAMGEALSFGFSLVVFLPNDRKGCKTRIVLLPSRITRWGFLRIAWVYPSTVFNEASTVFIRYIFHWRCLGKFTVRITYKVSFPQGIPILSQSRLENMGASLSSCIILVKALLCF